MLTALSEIVCWGIKRILAVFNTFRVPYLKSAKQGPITKQRLSKRTLFGTVLSFNAYFFHRSTSNFNASLLRCLMAGLARVARCVQTRPRADPSPPGADTWCAATDGGAWWPVRGLPGIDTEKWSCWTKVTIRTLMKLSVPCWVIMTHTSVQPIKSLRLLPWMS